tara:strand:+ start:3197 stop:4072 length:876 start_codon:yes stop_codon:yes gene_type:complete
MVQDQKEFNMLCFPRLGDYGRLGNAMFQYSALLGIADKHGYTPVYDYNKTGSHATLHEVFNISKADDMVHWEQIHGARRIWKEPTYHFANHAFDKTVIPAIGSSIKEDCGLNGYFQSEKYFKHIESTIRDEFKFSDEIQEECDEKIKHIKEATNDATLVSIHVRLGDYKALEHIYVPLIKTPYYQQAIGHFESEIEGDVVFIIFSDEIEVCKQLFQGNNCVFAEGGTEAQDMCLMSKCDHNIIANSSFSWWGAWLNNTEDKIVIAPNNWFIPNEKDPKDTKDLYCENWIVI